MTTIATQPVGGPSSPSDAPSAPSANGASDPGSGLLPPPIGAGLGGGSMAVLAELLTRADEQDRTASRQMETAADQAAMQEAEQHAQDLRDKANADLCEGLATGVAEFAEGALTVGGAFAESAQTSLTALGKGAEAAGAIGAGLAKGDGDRDEAHGVMHDAQSQQAIRLYNRAHDDAQGANQSIESVQRFLDQVQQTQNATHLAAATFRA